MDEIISELELAVIECRAHVVVRTNDERGVEHLREAARRIEQALNFLKSIQGEPRRRQSAA